jgi:hypothetical protein
MAETANRAERTLSDAMHEAVTKWIGHEQEIVKKPSRRLMRSTARSKVPIQPLPKEPWTAAPRLPKRAR